MRTSDDAGSTLVELLIVTAMAGMLATAVAAAFAIGFATSDEAASRLAGSQGAQILTSFFASDVRSSTAVRTATAGPAMTSSCASGSTSVVHFTWHDEDDTANPFKSSEYCLTTSSPRDLVREFRAGPVTATTLQGGATTIAHDLTSASAVCVPAACAPGTAVTMTVTESGGFVYNVTGRRRTP